MNASQVQICTTIDGISRWRTSNTEGKVTAHGFLNKYRYTEGLQIVVYINIFEHIEPKRELGKLTSTFNSIQVAWIIIPCWGRCIWQSENVGGNVRNRHCWCPWTYIRLNIVWERRAYAFSPRLCLWIAWQMKYNNIYVFQMRFKGKKRKRVRA